MSERTARRITGAAATALAAALLGVTACTGTATNAGDGTGASAEVAGTEHVCSSCHGPAGRSVNPTFPNLAGQQKDYLVAQLMAFRDHTRADPHAHTYMWGMAARLSDATIDGLAAFYSGEKPAPGGSADPAALAGGGAIYATGVPAQNVPPCMSCHGDKALGAGAIPRLAGQHRSYLEGQLEAFQSNARANEIMHATSKDLTELEITQVAAYLAAQ